ncbi:uncharacterized protein EI97DRAFT_458404 [Westerdykella ornata]|uniref:Uncharacterized protein n=1 Tax=Westerdykella ornata TaxID=318751 RepID=A0A6A6JKJ6_WESOR|nr:uncharacterized protein EI97DRAFT_458404 [Westerdykella ornata]KAF2276478.1 hypothetical protein EI97DRAFT_458404 [Westerdykella ornata]
MATVPTKGMSLLVGQSFVDLDAGETKEVLCLSPWTPIVVGHFCVICEISAPEDPSPFTSDSHWDIHDRHVAQHNIDVIEPPSVVRRPHLGSFVVAGLPNEPYSTVIARRASDGEFKAAIRLFGGDALVQRNITADTKFGLISNFSAGDPIPDLDGLGGKLVFKDLKPKEQKNVSAAVQLPHDPEHASAAVIFIEQIDAKNAVVGGLAIVALNRPLRIGTEPVRARAAVPVSIPFRPYSTFPESNFMTPDGIFCSNFGIQNINVQVRNDGSSTLTDLTVYVEGVADPNITLRYSRSSPPGGSARSSASFKSIFQGNFSRAASNETLVSFIVQQQSGTSSKSVRIVKKIFVLGIEYNKTTKTFTVNVPQGSFQTNVRTVIVPRELPTENEKPITYPMFLKGASMLWLPIPPYGGTHGPLPFEDPWWKVILCLIALALEIAGAVEAVNAGGDASIGTSNPFADPDGSENCCTGLEVQASTDSYAAAGLFATAAAVAVIALLSDDADLIDRGRSQTVPNSGELTSAERASFESDFNDAPSPGTPFTGRTTWSYERTLGSRSLTHSATDTYQNVHYLQSYKVSLDSAPVTDPNHHHAHPRSEPLLIEASFVNPSGALFRGPTLYVFVLLWSNHREKRLLELRDDGSDSENIEPNRGVYRNSIRMGREESKTWYVFVFAQDVNTVVEGTGPREAAKTIGGALLTRQFVVGLGSKPCELNHDAIVDLT